MTGRPLVGRAARVLLRARAGLAGVAVAVLGVAPARADEVREVVPLWAGGAPGSEARRHEPEVARDWWVRNIHHPSLTVFRPAAGRANGTAVIVVPGGGHRECVFPPEGVEPARFLAGLGVTAFALKYRLFREADSPYTFEHPAADIRRAVRLVRSRAAEWGVDPSRVGVMGWSAGGELAAVVPYQPAAGTPDSPDPVERVSARPDFQILVYPGPLGTPARLPPDAPPALFLTANDDESPARTLSLMLEKYRAVGIPAEAHFFGAGGHGFNMGGRSAFRAVRGLPQRIEDWLHDRGLLAAAPGRP
jgi:acetyl esterase/lipase